MNKDKRAEVKAVHSPVMDASKLPLRKRWPGKYALRLVVYTPSGTRLEFETHSSNGYAKKLIDDFTDLVCGREPRAALPETEKGEPSATPETAGRVVTWDQTEGE